MGVANAGSEANAILGRRQIVQIHRQKSRVQGMFLMAKEICVCTCCLLLRASRVPGPRCFRGRLMYSATLSRMLTMFGAQLSQKWKEWRVKSGAGVIPGNDMHVEETMYFIETGLQERSSQF